MELSEPWDWDILAVQSATYRALSTELTFGKSWKHKQIRIQSDWARLSSPSCCPAPRCPLCRSRCDWGHPRCRWISWLWPPPGPPAWSGTRSSRPDCAPAPQCSASPWSPGSSWWRLGFSSQPHHYCCCSSCSPHTLSHSPSVWASWLSSDWISGRTSQTSSPSPPGWYPAGQSPQWRPWFLRFCSRGSCSLGLCRDREPHYPSAGIIQDYYYIQNWLTIH